MKTLLEYFEDLRKQNTFEWVKDIEITDVHPGHCEMLFHTDGKRHVNFRGDLHGAVAVGFSDSLMGTSCFTLGKSVSTIDMNGNYVKACKGGEKLRGVANVEHNGNRTMVATCRIYDQSGDLIFLGRGTFHVLGKQELPDLPWSPFDTSDGCEG